MKTIVVIPTYNEKENIGDLIALIRAEADPALDILVVDSASPDGTASYVKELQKSDHKVYLFEQHAKLGLGKAYLDGMKWVLQRDYKVLITMDADFSHHPRYLNTLLKSAETYDLSIGSRYIPGGGLANWPKSREALSRFANWYACTLTGLPFSDLTSGFHCFRTSLLRKVLRYNIHTEGYAFLVELKFLSILQGALYKEIPIIFADRERGYSKISRRVILESILFVLKRSIQRGRVCDMVKKAKKREIELNDIKQKSLVNCFHPEEPNKFGDEGSEIKKLDSSPAIESVAGSE